MACALATAFGVPALAQEPAEVLTPPASAEVEPESVPAVGERRTILTVPEFGRYSIELKSRAGARLEAVDRMAGTLGADGVPGERDGRLDLLLDRGDYLLKIESPELPTGAAAAGRGAVAVTVTRARELQPDPLELRELESASATLGDHEQASWWFALDERRPVYLEAAGRHLADLRLFREGRWLEAGEPICAPRQPVVGRPLADCRLELDLAPGLYRLSAFGGPGLAWSDGADERPLHVRRGLRRLPEAGRARFRMGPTGTERFLVPQAADYYRLELATPGSARLRVGKLRGVAPFFSGAQATAWIGKRTIPPIAEFAAPATDPEPIDEGFALEPPSAAEPDDGPPPEELEEALALEEGVQDPEWDEAEEEYDAEGEYESEYDESYEEEAEPEANEESGAPDPELRWVEIAAAPGQEFVLQQFERRWYYAIPQPGNYWISVLQGVHALDEAELTAVLVRLPKSADDRDQLIVETAPRVDPARPWAARFNLRGETTIFLRVAATAKYEVRVGGLEPRVRVEPFFTSPPRDYRVPDWRASGKSWDLEAGLHVLTIEGGGRAGVVDVAMAAPGRAAAALAGLVGPVGSPPSAPADRAPGRLGAVTLERDASYAVYVGRRPGVETGILVRELPLDPTASLPLTLLPGERLPLALTLSEAGRLELAGEGAAGLVLGLDGAVASPAPSAGVGEHALVVENPGAAAADATLVFTPDSVLTEPALRPLAPEALADLPDFPTLTDRVPLAADLERGGNATFAVAADRPALYRLESTGLLAVEGSLRTRTLPLLDRASENGSGRNFLLERYLREGDYQLTVAALGQSAGHLGVRLARAELADGGRVRPGEVARLGFARGQGASFELEVPRPARLRVRGLGPGFVYTGRLDDADGWPEATPSTAADWELDLAPGDYRMVLFPQGDATRALAVVEEIVEPVRGDEHGPVELALGRAHFHRWREPAAAEAADTDAPRPPDVYGFTLPARATVRVTLDAEMQGVLVAETGGDRHLVPPGRPFERELAPGRWRLEAVCSRRNNLVDYSVEVATAELVAGVERELAAPVEETLAVGDAPLVWLTSWATAPVRATLLDSEGGAVARGETRKDDWSFHLGARLAPGRYRLRLEPLSDSDASVRVAFAAPAETVESTWDATGERALALADTVRLVPLAPARASSGELVVVEARAAGSVALALEAHEPEGWRTVASSAGRTALVAAVAESGELRVRVAALDRTAERVELSGARLAPRGRAESELSRGVRLEPQRGLPAGLGAARVGLATPGVFRLRGAPEIGWASGPGAAPRPVGDAPALAGGRDLWLLGPAGATVSGARERLTPDQAPQRLRLAAGESAGLDLAAGEGGATGLTLATATSAAGSPWLAFVGARGAPGVTGATAVAPGGALAATLGAASRIEVRDGDGAPAEIDLRLRRVSLAPPESVGAGPLSGRVAPDAARPFDLPAGRKLLRLALGGGVAALTADAGSVRSAHWGGGALAEELVTDATRLLLVATTESEAPYAVEILPAPASASDLRERLEPGALFETVFPAAGRRRLAVAPGAQRLRARGDGVTLTLVEPDGAVRRGRDLTTRAGGEVAIEHGAGTALVWSEPENGPSPLVAAAAPELALSAPASAPLAGDAVAVRVTVPGAGVLEISASTPAVVVAGGDAPHVDLHPRGVRLATLVGADGRSFLLRGAGGAPLAGALAVSWAPVERVGEGLGAPLALAPGASRFVAFEVPTARRVGVGVRADSAAVEATLYDAGGRALGAGVAQLHDLAAGRYLLALRLPADAAPAVARPAVVGLEPPPTTPPEEILRGYLAAADGATEPPPETEE